METASPAAVTRAHTPVYDRSDGRREIDLCRGSIKRNMESREQPRSPARSLPQLKNRQRRWPELTLTIFRSPRSVCTSRFAPRRVRFTDIGETIAQRAGLIGQAVLSGSL